ncbi:penicillin acylase family protein [Shewanella sp. KJ10-1]|uniref:Penicillin acylase family protein n=1 Tax=Shewanella phaeophyticola TaxID=2978345 RepID=A0ABT2P546_9GAMM|nr:penicillin acylase family protein [Shewanella sp. KJ10-1]
MDFNKLLLAVGVVSTTFIVGCGDDTDFSKTTQPTPEPEVIPLLQAFAPNGALKAQIRRTEYGVPHITADNLESLGFGSGYAQAQDNLCVIADGFIKANSERSMYFDLMPQSTFQRGCPPVKITAI